MAVCKQLRRSAFLLCVLAAAVSAGTAGAARPLVTGVEVPNSTWQNLEDQYLKAEGGVRTALRTPMVRIVVEWRGVETSPGSYDFASSGVDNRIVRAVNHGLTPLVTVWKAPNWAEHFELGTGSGKGIPGTYWPDAAAYGDFAAALMSRYDGHHGLPRVRYWEVWNEPNLMTFLNPQKNANGTWRSPVIYRNLLNAFYDAATAANNSNGNDPDNIVIAGSNAPFKRKPSQPGPKPFIRGVLCLTSTLRPISNCGPARLDGWSVHPYTAGSPTHHAIAATDVSLGDLPEVKAILNAAVRHGKIQTNHAPVDFWISEFGWDTRGPDPYGISLGVHARWTAEAMYRAWRAGVTHFVWHQVRDRPYPMNAYQSGFYFCGLASLSDDSAGGCGDGPYSNDARKLASIRALRFPFVAFRVNGRLVFWGRTPDSSGPATVIIQRKTSRGWANVKTLTANALGIFQGSMLSSRTTGFYRARLPKTLANTDWSNAFSLVSPRVLNVQPFG